MDSSSAAAKQEQDLVGKHIGHYRVVRKLGAGGMGAVFEAVHEQIGKRAAIKLLHREFSQDPEFALRFFNEARAVNLVQHNGLVNIYEFGQLPDGAAYIVMDYLDGETLSARIKRSGGRLGLEGLNLIRQIASALSAAHGKGIIHRDLKPANIVVVAEPEAPGGERAKILDFGVAKMGLEERQKSEGGEPVAEVAHTRTGVFMGTPRYMAPEQCRGAGRVDEKADVYSLGCILYQILGGATPFSAPGEGEIMAMHIFATPRPLRDREPTVPEGLAQLTHSMLAKEPTERPNMAQVAAELGRFTGAMTGAMQAYSTTGSVSSLALPASLAQGALPEAHIPREASSSIARAAGQSDSIPRQKTRARLLILAGGPVLAVALTVAVISLSRGPRPGRPAPPVATAAPHATAAPVVRWSIASDPEGAEVVRESDGKVLGTTPWRAERPAETGSAFLLLRRAGFTDRRVTVDLGEDVAVDEKLVADAAPKAPAVDATKATAALKLKKRPPTPPPPHRGKTGLQKDLDDDDDIPLVK